MAGQASLKEGNVNKDVSKKHCSETLSQHAMRYIHISLVVIIAIVLIFAIGMLVTDIYDMLSESYASGMGRVLGSLLMVWVVLELLEAQIDHLNGQKMNASLFIVVAIVAFIKKLLIAALLPDQIEYAYFTLAVVVVLSLVYLILRFIEVKLSDKPMNT